jgi:hypothetical protein
MDYFAGLDVSAKSSHAALTGLIGESKRFRGSLAPEKRVIGLLRGSAVGSNGTREPVLAGPTLSVEQAANLYRCDTRTMRRRRFGISILTAAFPRS